MDRNTLTLAPKASRDPIAAEMRSMTEGRLYAEIAWCRAAWDASKGGNRAAGHRLHAAAVEIYCRARLDARRLSA